MKKIAFLSISILGLILLGLSDMKMQGKREKSIVEETEVLAVNTVAAEEQKIRVLLKNDYFESEYHESVQVASQKGFVISDGENSWQVEPGESKNFDVQSSEFSQSGTLFLESRDGAFLLPELERDRSSDVYEGALEIRKTERGLLVINVLPMEEYLCGVVPSEMPSSYPKEALKSQAICARTYAMQQIAEGRAKEFFADVDDSVEYQVYNNQDRSESTDQAVKETDGYILLKDGALVDAFYYSTSCGLDTGIDLSGETVFAAFISGNNIQAYEAEEPWYRWKTELLLDCWEDVKMLEIRERQPSGMAEKLCVIDSEGTEQIIEGEYSIRKFLADAMQTIILQDEENVSDMSILPSAFFVLEPEYENGVIRGYEVLGGGYGHGKGMSQNGAKHMAQEGLNCSEILKKYYQGAEVEAVGDYLAKNIQS